MENSYNEKQSLTNQGYENDHATITMEQKGNRHGVRKDISFHNLCYTVPVKFKGKKIQKEILKNISGILKPGLNAILGPTGSGKTSLLDILAGRKDKRFLTGDVIVDGERQPDDFRLMSGYVVQENIIMGTLTVEENLQFSANLRLPGSFSKSERKEYVQHAITDLQLSDVANSKVGNEFKRGISGGEKKRTMIGMELITSPDILFLDEPTTGLDSATAYSVMALLKKQADAGKTIVFSIHQPRYSIFQLFDYVTLLSAGEIVYHGECSKALNYFQEIGYECEKYNNPPDFMLDIISNERKRKYVPDHDNGKNLDYAASGNGDQSYQETLANAYKKSSLFENTIIEIRPMLDSIKDIEPDIIVKKRKFATYQSSFSTQFFTLSWRNLLNILRNPQLLISQTFITIIFALLIGTIYFQLDQGKDGLQNRIGVLLFLIMNVVFSNIGAVQLFIKEKVLFRHESASGYYRVSSYFISKSLCDIIMLRLVPTIMYACITYWMVGLVADVFHFLIFGLVIFITAVCACSLAFFVSASVRAYPVAQILMVLPTIIMLIFSGVFINVNSMPIWLNWLKYLSLFRYALAILLINELEGMAFDCGNYTLTDQPKPCISGDEYLRSQGIDPSDKSINIIAIVSIIAGLMVLAYIQLRRLKKFK